jgi:hypothetical protein
MADRPRRPGERPIVTTHLSFGDWSAVFGDAKMGFIADCVTGSSRVESGHMRSLSL